MTAHFAEKFVESAVAAIGTALTLFASCAYVDDDEHREFPAAQARRRSNGGISVFWRGLVGSWTGLGRCLAGVSVFGRDIVIRVRTILRDGLRKRRVPGCILCSIDWCRCGSLLEWWELWEFAGEDDEDPKACESVPF